MPSPCDPWPPNLRAHLLHRGVNSENKQNRVALFTGGGDRPYALGLASALISRGIFLDFIGSDYLSAPELRKSALVRFLNLRGDQSPDASYWRKCVRVILYYVRLVTYAATAEPRVFHILWNGKLEGLDRILLPYYKLLGKRLLFTAHNVNAGKRDGNDSWFNRLSLKFQYKVLDHIFVHTLRMKDELIEEFAVPQEKISVIPFGINETVPTTELSPVDAKKRLGLNRDTRTLLFFGNIAPYKGLEYLVESLAILSQTGDRYCAVIAGKPKNCRDYWDGIRKAILRHQLQGYIIESSVYIPEEEVEVYFKASDVLILPYTHIYQSGVLFLSYYFGLPVVAADVGSLREDVIEGRTGFICRPKDPHHLAATIRRYFQSELYRNLEKCRRNICEYAQERYSWSKAAEEIHRIYDAQRVQSDSISEKNQIV